MKKEESNRLKTFRLSLGFKDGRTFAASIDVNHNTYYAYERGDIEIAYNVIKNLVYIHNMSANWFFTGIGEMFIKPKNTLERTNKNISQNRKYSGRIINEIRVKHNYITGDMCELLKCERDSYFNLIECRRTATPEEVDIIIDNFDVTSDYVNYGIKD